jgi:hypothetical protein
VSKYFDQIVEIVSGHEKDEIDDLVAKVEGEQPQPGARSHVMTIEDAMVESTEDYGPIEQPAEATGRPLDWWYEESDGAILSRTPQYENDKSIESGYRGYVVAETVLKATAERIIGSLNAHEASRRLAETWKAGPSKELNTAPKDAYNAWEMEMDELARQVLDA